MQLDDAMTVQFTSLLDALPSASMAFSPTGRRPDVGVPSRRAADFVAPCLAPTAVSESLSNYQAIVISAAGAVGKSTLAKEIAAARGLPLWNLAASGSVGQGSLQGMISQAFGIGSVAAIDQALSGGRYGLVIDALDEGRIRVSETSFEDFIKDVGDLAKTLPGPGLILLGRTQIARTAWWQLEDAGVRVALLEISHFDREQRQEYIEKKVRSLNPSAGEAAEKYSVPFAAARDKVFELLSHAVTGGQADHHEKQADLFLGYSPVLDAVSVLLASEKNFAALLQDITRFEAGAGDAQSRGPVTILRKVVETIMKREQQQKLVPNMKLAIDVVAAKHGWSRWDDLYSIDEQSARLLGVYLQSPETVRIGLNLPDDLIAAYEEHLRPWLNEHPFLRDGAQIGNAVFESFLIAQALVSDVGGMRAPIEARLRDARHKPNPLMAEFYLDLISDGLPLRVGHVGFLYDSLLSGLRESHRMIFSFNGGDVADDRLESEAEVAFEFVDEEGEPVRPAIERCVPVDLTSELTFTRYLKDADIDTGIDVVLGAGTNEYELGPRVSIECRVLHVEAAALVVTGARSDAEPDDFGVTLQAGECHSKVAALPRVRTKLQVAWPGAEAFPWAKYASKAAKAPPEAREAFSRFRRIVLTLRSHKKGSLARVRDKVESQHVVGDGVGPRVLERLKFDGLLRLEGKFYHWVPDRADAVVGVSWLQLRNNEASDKLWKYLATIT